MIYIPNFKKIPKDAETHYEFSVHYPYPQNITPKTVAGNAPRPQIQRKVFKNKNQMITEEMIMENQAQDTIPQTARKKQRKIERKHKAAKAQLFNDAETISPVEQWRMDVTAELDAASEKRSRSPNTTAMHELTSFYDLLGMGGLDYKNASAEQLDEINRDHIHFITTSEEELDYLTSCIKDELIPPVCFDEAILVINYVVVDTHSPLDKMAKYDPWAEIARFAHDLDKQEEIRTSANQNIEDRFVKKYKGADTSAAMRAYEKQKRNSTKLAYWMHELGLTK